MKPRSKSDLESSDISISGSLASLRFQAIPTLELTDRGLWSSRARAKVSEANKNVIERRRENRELAGRLSITSPLFDKIKRQFGRGEHWDKPCCVSEQRLR